MQRAGIALVIVLWLAPAVALAAAAGFAPGSIWLSSTSASAGETLTVYTVLYDSTSAPISGDVVFDVDSAPLQTVHFSLQAGQTQVVSAPWKSAQGKHSFSATLKNLSGVSSTASNETTDVVSITVTPAPPTPASQYQSTVNNIYDSAPPQVQQAAQAVASTTEGIRQAGINYLQNALSESPAPVGHVLGTSTSLLSSAAPSSSSGVLAAIWDAILTGLLFIFRIQVLFYIALAVVIYVLFKIIQGIFRFRRREY